MTKSRARDLFDQFEQDGESTIDKFIAEQISEELFIDYKRAANDGKDSKLQHNDRENFARAISAFGNSEGGIIVWGVDCRTDPVRGDVPNKKVPIVNPKRFTSYLEGTTSGCTIPPHDGVRHHVIEQGTTGNGFVVTFIPKSMYAPHQCIVGKFKDRYYVRFGSNFELAPHAVLAAMFGRQPTPNIFHVWACGGRMSPSSYAPVITDRPTSTPYVVGEFTIRNHGVTVARDLYINFDFGGPGPHCIWDMRSEVWTFSKSMGGWHLISNDGYRLPPAAMVPMFTFNVFLKPPFEFPLAYEISFGCHGSPVHRICSKVPADVVQRSYTSFVNSDQGRKAGRELAKAVLGLGQEPAYAKDVEY